ncbi:MAG: carboxypeptidase regulatory-like domain-containing protein, partial [Desulfobacteraceae bacterium]|nr:carboxypeptidase regulatory-like domain-containing protein [Desulfobacteraceae bacterium]
RDETGELLSGQTVKLSRSDNGALQAVKVTEPSGSFNFQNIPMGEYTLAVSGYEIFLGPVVGAGTLEGVLADSMGEPLPGQTAKLYRGQDGTLKDATTTGEDGSYRFQNIPAGPYRLAVDGYEISIDPITGTGNFEGVLISTTGNPLSGETIGLYRDDGILQVSTTTDTNGSFRLQNIPAGRYRLAVDRYEISDGVPVGTSKIRGFLTDDKGQALSGQTLRLALIDDATSQRTTIADASGEFVFQNLAAGNYHLSVDRYEINTVETIAKGDFCIDDFISLVKNIEASNPALSGEDILNGLRRIAGYDTEYFQKIYGDIPPAKKLNFGTIQPHILKGMISHDIKHDVEFGVVKDRFGYDVSMGHVLTGVSGGQHRITDVDLTPWYKILFGIVGFLAGEEMDNLYAVTISGDLGQSAYMVNEGLYEPPYIGMNTEATHAELIGDIDGVLIGKNIATLLNGKNLGSKAAEARLSELLSNYYQRVIGEMPSPQVTAVNRFDDFSNEDTDYIEEQVKKFAINYTYYREGKLEGLLSFTGGEAEEAMDEFKEWLQKMKHEELKRI